MRNKKEEQELEQEITEQSEEQLKKKSRKVSVEKRKAKKRQDKVVRFAGLILLFVVLMLGFLLWVAGEARNPYVGY